MLAPWFAEVTQHLQRGTALFIDYGYSRDEYYAAHRVEGTLRCHYRHRAHDDPLIFAGLQDITAWVDFDALGETATTTGFRIEAYCSQADYLIAHNLNEVFAGAYAGAADEVARYRLAQEVKRLTLPGEMGETFRVMAMSR